jgi:hypothetical protein
MVLKKYDCDPTRTVAFFDSSRKDAEYEQGRAGEAVKGAFGFHKNQA